MIKKLHHVGIAVKNLDETIRLFNQVLNSEPVSVFEAGAAKTRIAQYQVGEALLEFLEATPGSSTFKFVQEKGEGVHHISFEVDDVEAELEKQAGLGIKLIDKTPRPSPMGRIAFIGPEGSSGTIIELVQQKEKAPSPNTIFLNKFINKDRD
jgi:methylmalonyl-CoA epimerase